MSDVVVKSKKAVNLEVLADRSADNAGEFATVAVKAPSVESATSPDAKRLALRFTETEYRYVKPGIDNQSSPRAWLDAEGKRPKAGSKEAAVVVVYKVRNSN